MIEHPCVQETVVEVMMEMDVPLYKLRHPSLKKLADICNREMPSESFGRKLVTKFADKKLATIKTKIGNSPYYLIADESQYKKSKYVLVIIGNLHTPNINYVGCCKVVQTADSSSVLIVTDDFIKSLALERERFLLFISDAATYMVNCAESLKLLYPKMRHVTCLSHLLHNCAENVRISFPAVDKLIASVKAATHKNRTRQQLFVDNGISLPPQPVLTRWGSWLEAAMFYAEYFIDVQRTVLSFEDDRFLVASAKSAVSDARVQDELILICLYRPLVAMVKKFESKNATIVDAFRTLKNLMDTLRENDPAEILPYIEGRIQRMKDLREIVEGDGEEGRRLQPSEYSLLQNAPPSGADVERAFSRLNSMLEDNRNFAESNVEKYFLCYANLNSD